MPDSDTCSQRVSCCPGPAGGIWRPKRLFTNPMSIFFGVQGASEIVLGVRNMFIGSLTPVPLDRNQKTFFFISKKKSRKYIFDFLGNFLENRAKFWKSKFWRSQKFWNFDTKKSNFFFRWIFSIWKKIFFDQDFF